MSMLARYADRPMKGPVFRHETKTKGGSMNAQLAELPEEGQLDFFDASVYKESLFSIAGVNKHKAPRELKPKEAVSGRFWGTVVGMDISGFASETQEPNVVYKIAANEVTLD
jgi:hypothetical protein